ncbi:MAG TPA: zf-HC2 domain-containing protein [Pyrinomonadaceae bacterium]|nr:zf-HC2 domain-containing protein [Pyrinomonadaceae bacterium]
MRECIDEGILQAYTDNELSSEMAARVAEHISACAACAGAASAAAEETALFARAFEAELALDVPTVRLRERLDDAIAELERPSRLNERKPASSLGGWLASLGGLFTVAPQRALGFAGLVAVLAFAAIFAVMKLNKPEAEVAQPSVASSGQPQTTNPTVTNSPTPAPTASPLDSSDERGNKGNEGGKDNAPSKRAKPRKPAAPVLVPQPDQLPQQELAAKPLPGEQNYLKAIDSLSQEIAASGETAMKPSLRAEYERNLAIVDQAIVSTRRTARRNPSDADAAEFLYSSYQSKLDLLNTVAEQVRPTIATR